MVTVNSQSTGTRFLSPEVLARIGSLEIEHLKFPGNDVIVFQVLDRLELDFDFQEPVVLEDSETEEQLHVMPDVLRDEYLRQIRAHVDALSQGAARKSHRF